MFSRLKGARPSPALVISLVALFVSLGGVGYAAVTITGKNVKNGSLTGTDIKNSSLTGKDVKNSSLTTSDVKNSSLLATDFKAGQLPRGATGPAGANGHDGVVNLTYKTSAPIDNPIASQDFGEALCDPGQHAVGGGAVGGSSVVGQDLNGSFPEDTSLGDGANGWGAFMDNQTLVAQTFTVYAICTTAGSVSASPGARTGTSAKK
jgi:hypothetical protein